MPRTLRKREEPAVDYLLDVEEGSESGHDAKPAAATLRIRETSDQAGLLPEPESVQRPAPERALKGHVDLARWPFVKGWVWDPELPNERIRLVLAESGNRLLTTVASVNRPDIAMAGIGDGLHGFEIDLNQVPLTAGRHTLTLCCADGGTEIPGSPLIVDVPTDQSLPAGAAEADDMPSPRVSGAPHGAVTLSAKKPFRAFVDEVSDRGIDGWIAVSEQPSRRCVVVLRHGDRLLSRAVASEFRADLIAAGIGDGCHAFSLPMPRSLLDGEEHLLEIIEQESGLPLTDEPIRWRSTVGTGDKLLASMPPQFADQFGGIFENSLHAEAKSPPLGAHGATAPTSALPTPVRRRGTGSRSRPGSGAVTGTRILIDVSDLVYYIGHHPNLTGIQRVQSSIVLSIVANELCPLANILFVSFDAKGRRWVAIPTGFLVSLLEDLFLPPAQRLVGFSAEEARHGVLPGATPFDGVGVLDDGNPSVLCLLGAAWVQRDYLHRVLALKRRFGTRFVMTVHDLIPIYARETCDQGTARVFEEFLRRALRHVDHFLSVSENTAKDLYRYCASLGLPEPPVTVTRNGASFAEFLAAGEHGGELRPDEVPHRFVLFVATVEGRKNHRMMLEIWRALTAELDDSPYLVCVGRVGWKSESFIADLVETNYLNGKVILLQDISDADLRLLYSRCLFTVFPSMYEGWGLPVGESLAAGKVCVCSDRSSIPEVAGEFGVYIDIDDVDEARRVIGGLISDRAKLKRLEAKIRDRYKPDSWASVAEKVVAACRNAADVEWREPYPFVSIPYSSEIGFAWLGRDAEGCFGDDLLARIVDTRKGHFLNEPLQELSFLRGEEARASGSWAEPEHWGTWLCRSPGEVVVGLPPSDSQLFYVFLRLRVTGPLSEKAVKISANGESVCNASIGNRPKDVRFAVRRRTTGRGGWRLRIRAEIDLSAELEAQIAGMDSRVPTIGFERLVVVPEDDLKTRLDILYTLLL
jgi:glycosyltransferase involved in cell wall biosynthesis